MKKLSILFAALIATTMSFAADYEKVTAAPADWSGEYLIVYENSKTEAYVFNGEDAEGDYTTEIITDNKITTTTAVSFKVAKNGKKYSILILGGKNDGKYLGHSGAKNGIKIADKAIDNIIEYSDQNKNTVIRNEDVATLQFNNAATNGNRFRYYTKLSQQKIQLYKKVAGVPVPATAIALDQTELEMEQYKYIKLVATLTPADATTEVVWTTSNDKVATVENGLVNVVASTGTATITATAGTFSATCEITAKAATVLTCADAKTKALSVSADNEVLAGGKYVIHGYVTELIGKPSDNLTQYGNYSVWMADAKDGGKVFQAYQVAPTDGKTIVAVGDYVEVIGDLTKFNTTPETVGKTGTIAKTTPVGTAIDATVEETKAVKRIINGVLVIEKDNVLYNAQGIRL